MAFAVKWQMEHWGCDLRPGDVMLSNSPGKFLRTKLQVMDVLTDNKVCGGTHLPDLTVITPVFDEEGKTIIFWTASRGHHADVSIIIFNSIFSY
jgi:5-oxoprolinase (ATP-hydrolysing)